MALILMTDLSHLATSFTTDTWIVLGAVMAFGMLGGWAHRLGAPGEDATTLLGHVVLGAVAALGALWIIDPTDPVKLIALSVIAGYAGKALMSSLQARVEAATAKAAAKKANEQKDEAIRLGKEATGLAKQITDQAEGETNAAAKILVDSKTESVERVLPKLWTGIKRAPDASVPNWTAHHAPRRAEVAALDAKLDMLKGGIV